MTLIIKQSTAYKLPVVLIDDTDFKSEETGVAYNAAGTTVRYAKEAADGDHTWSTKTLTSADWEELGHGLYLIKFSATELNTVGKFLYYYAATGILPYYGEAYIIQEDTLDGRLNDIHDTLDLTKTETDTHPTLAEIEATTVLAKEATFTHATYGLDKIKTETAAIKTVTDNLPDSGALTTIQADLDNPSQYKATGFSTHAAADVWTVGTRALTDKAGFSLSVAGVDAIIDDVIEGTLTLRQAVRIYLAALAGKSAGGGTATITFRDKADSKNRISATVDADGNRTAVTLDGT